MTTPSSGDPTHGDEAPDLDLPSSARWSGRARVSGAAQPESSAAPSGGSRTPPPRVTGPGVYGGKKKVRPRWGRIALVFCLALLLVAGAGTLGVWLYAKNIDNKITRDDPFSEITGERPPVLVDGALNILMLGSDSRDPDANSDGAGKWRTDTIVLMHIPASHDKAYLISIPRDTYVYIPKSANGQYGDTKAKINAAYAWGGTSLMVQTVENFTGVHIDHVALIDFGGFVQVTDALGGVDMNIEKTITSIHKPFRTFKKGMNHLNGAEALDYCRQRYQFADGDFARIRHQQEFLKALLDKATSTGTLANPSKLDAFLTSVTASMTVDKDFSIIDMAIEFRGLRSNSLKFMVSPNKGSDNVDGQSVVVSDKEKAVAFYDAVAKDNVEAWLTQSQATPGSTG